MKEAVIFGGTFDPPTIAHEAIIGACLELPTDEVWVLPSGLRYDKNGMVAAQDRLAMLGLIKSVSFNGNQKLIISDFELQLPPPNQTYKTVAALRLAYPQHNFRFVFGTDSYAGMGSWDLGAKLKKTLDILLVERTGHEAIVVGDNARWLELIDYNDIVSSSGVRSAVQTGEDISSMVSPAVATYITENGLYREP